MENVEKTVEKRKRGRPKGTYNSKNKRLLELYAKRNPIKTVKLLPKQIEFFNDKHKEILLCGGMGSGKSLVLCLKLIQQASIPGNVCLLIRKFLTTLKKSTLRMLLESEGDREALLPPGSYEHNKQDRTIQIYGGGTILYTGADDPLSIRSINCGDVFIDEVTELDEEEYTELLLRLRVNVGSLTLYAVTNPSGKNHFLYKRFVIDKNPVRKIIYANSLENIFLPESARNVLSDLKGDAYDKFVDGQWSNKEKIIYPNFNQEKVVKNIEGIEYVNYILGVDYGYTHPTGILLCGLDKENRMYIISEWREQKKLQRDIMKQIISYKDFNPTILVDPSAAGLIAECQSQGLNALKANNDVNLGIERIKSKFEDGGIIISKECDKLISEIENYSYGEDWKPIKINDDLVDPLRYIANQVIGDIADKAIENANTTNFYIF